MGYVKTGAVTRVFDSTILTVDHLPVGIYDIAYNDMQGFSLVDHGNLQSAGKVYGNSYEKVEKVMNAFEHSGRNFGVLLSGPKGSGKSIFTRLVCDAALKKGYPVILASHYYSGIAQFIGSIHDVSVVLFDEFDKHFSSKGNSEIQNELLSLFDGIDDGRKLFLCTCNELECINQYFISRPGRFHYHLITQAPSANEIREYLADNLDKIYYTDETVNKILAMSAVNQFTYDILRAVVFELNLGYSLSETMSDLNIAAEECNYYILRIKLANGMTIELENSYALDLSDNEDYSEFKSTNYGDELKFSIRVNSDSVGNFTNNGYKINQPECNSYYVSKKQENFEYKTIITGSMVSPKFTREILGRIDNMDKEYDWCREIHSNIHVEDFEIVEAYLVPNPNKYNTMKKIRYLKF